MAKNALDAVRALFPLPDEKPDVAENDFGWLDEKTAVGLAERLSDKTKLVLECGSLFGKSTRWIAEHAPNATILCLDHWQGSPEMRGPQWDEWLPKAYETFLASCWPLRERLVPIRMWTSDGLRLLAREGVAPDLVYLDAAHDYETVKADLEAILAQWPDAVLCGDDWNYPGLFPDGVERAVRDVLPAAGYTVRPDNPFWSAIKEKQS